jgi:hypothetical protein
MHRLRLAALGLLVLALAACVVAVPASARPTAEPKLPQTLPPPTGLHAFLLRADEQAVRTFPRTPSFAWNPVAGAWRYEFQLSTSLHFGEGTIVWESSDPTKPLRVPVVAVDVALPWITGNPYSLYARVRAIKLVPKAKETVTGTGTAPADQPATGQTGTEGSGTGSGGTGTGSGTTPPATPPPAATKTAGEEVFGAWSDPFGFNMRWTNVPTTMAGTTNARTGLIRWTAVAGATAYDVWVTGARRRFVTTTNVADTRDIFVFRSLGSLVTPTISWRVRAIRRVYGERPNGMPATSYGPWSDLFVETYPSFSDAWTGNIQLLEAISGDVASTANDPHVHEFTPAFRFTVDPLWIAAGGLYRVYVATDSDCVNVVYSGAAVSGPTYAPRATGPLKLPISRLALLALLPPFGGNIAGLDHDQEGVTWMRDGSQLTTTELASTNKGPYGARVDLWDTAWPNGGYYWTVVPVMWNLRAGSPDDIEWRDTELPQDACQAGRVMRFGKTTAAVVAAGNAPYASGLSPKGRLTSASAANPSFYGTPLVSWEPALGADSYEVQWSKTGYPWRMEGKYETGSTSYLLPVGPGTWYYRVRGLNNSLPQKPQMTWSLPMQIKVTAPTFRLVGGQAGGEAKDASGLVLQVAPSGFTIGIPESWETMSLSANNTSKFMARRALAQSGFHTNVNVVIDDRKPPKDTDVWRQALMAEAERVSGFVKGSLTAAAVKLPSGTGVKLTYQRKASGTTLAHVQYVVYPGDREYVITYTTLPSLLAGYKKTFELSAKSFRLT